jgi:hypothetical protein
MKTKVIILGLASLLVLCFTRISWAAAEKPDSGGHCEDPALDAGDAAI